MIFLRIVISSIVLLFLSVTILQAQMFSVGSVQQQTRPDAPVHNILFSYDMTDFSYFGPFSLATSQSNYNFNEPLYRLQYENPLLNIYGVFGRNLGENDDINVTMLGIAIFGMYTFSRSETYRVYMPLSINTDYTLVRTDETQSTSEEFAQNSGYLGGGLGFQGSITKNFRIDLRTVPHIGYTSGSFGGTGGVSWKVNATGRIFLDNLIRGFGLSAGYDLRFVRFNNTQESLNYDLLSNGFSIGITF
jgi:hypothetical protein